MLWKTHSLTCSLIFLITILINANAQTVTQTGELKKWHKITFTLDGPASSEGAASNPFLDYRFNVTFSHAGTGKSLVVPGYFAADGDAAESGATAGNKWRVHFAPEETGVWTYTFSFRSGTEVAIDTTATAGTAVVPYDGITGNFTVGATDKTGRDFRAKGRLNYVGEHFLQFAETGKYFLKGGADSPENFLAYYEFDNTKAWGGSNTRRTKGTGSFVANGITYTFHADTLHHYDAHVPDWNTGDPVWQTTKGKGIIGALNYLVSEGMNCISYLVMNIDGDGQDVYPYVNYNATYTPQDDRRRFDISKLAQWEIVLAHATNNGLFMDIKTQETENDQLLDAGQLGVERKLLYRELIARFSHHLGLQWNLGEENDIWSELSDPQNLLVRSYADYVKFQDPYDHSIVIHTYPGDQDEVYDPLLGSQSVLTGPALQSNSPDRVHIESWEWITLSADSGRKWIVPTDEIGPASLGLLPDTTDNHTNTPNNAEVVRKQVLWGNLMAGGAGMQAYFGYLDWHHDLDCEWFGSRDLFWDYIRYAIQFMDTFPLTEMQNLDPLIGNPTHDTTKFCLGKPGEVYLIYLPNGGSTNIDLTGTSGNFDLRWFNPRSGGPLSVGSVTSVAGGASASTGPPPADVTRDWLAVIQPNGVFPVKWRDFRAEVRGVDIHLNWSTIAEENSGNFHIRRKINEEEWQQIGKHPAAGNSSQLKSYQFQDKNPGIGAYFYQLVLEDIDGTFALFKNPGSQTGTSG